jgi:ATP-dependent HslUV protease ATP-binding subunit HslU
MPSNRTAQALARLADLTPKQIVAELDRYIVGQGDAKKAVAIALRNRWRRQRAPEAIRNEISPNNIILIGPTGVGKTEIARRLAKLAGAPFIKVEASKFTEVGYVGRDVESMVRDLVELGVDMLRAERIEEVRGKAAQNAEERLLDILLPPAAADPGESRDRTVARIDDAAQADERANRTREHLREQLRAGRLDARTVEIEVREKSFPSFEIIAGSSVEEVDINLKDMLPGLFQGKTKRRRLKVPEALEYLAHEEEQKLIDMDSVSRAAVERVQQAGIIFIDEIDKIAGREGAHGPDVSREGVQRDILPIVEGTTVNTKYGMVRTDHILFIAAGAFHVSKPSDLIPELQGRFPIRVELEALGKEEFVRILTEPRSALIKQYTALMETEGITLTFTDAAIRRIADFATLVNDRTENIGARRLHTVMEKLLDEISFEGPDLANKRVTIDDEYVTKMLEAIVKNEDLARYIL